MRENDRRIYLLNKDFQLRFAFYVCSWITALSIFYPLILSNLYDYLVRYLALDPMGPSIAILEKNRSEFMWLLFFAQVVIIVVIFLFSIFISHRIAGPLYKLRKYFQEVTAGNYGRVIKFRKKDYFQELAVDYNAMMESIQKRMSIHSQSVSTAIRFIEKACEESNPENKSRLEAALKVLRDAEKS